ncbi:MAG: pyridoxal-phosphate dependent enzyme [Labilithrix sp.]|nr:pyridoxal-phosphate dependent enzyme [Labilithrix sp.]
MRSLPCLGRRSFLAGAIVGCGRAPRSNDAPPRPSASSPREPPPTDAAAPPPRPAHALFEVYPALAATLPRAPLARFPSTVEDASAVTRSLWIKRDDDFTRGAPPADPLGRIFGGGKVRKLELYFGEARAQNKRRIITTGGVGSNQALAVALLGESLGFEVSLYLAPQPPSSLTAKNLAGDAASGAELRLFDSVTEAHARATREARERRDVYVIPPGGTTPLGTLGFVNAGLELAEDVRAGRLPSPRRIYVALGLGGSAAGLGIGCALAGLRTEIIGVRASSPASVSAATLRAIHDETVAFARARDPSFPTVKHENVRIDGRFVGGGYGVPTPAGDEAVARGRSEGWELDVVYTGKALAAILDDARASEAEPWLFWNTMSSRPVPSGAVPAAFRSFVRSSP